MEELMKNIILSGDVRMLILVPVCFTFFDVITGILKAIKNKEVNSSVSREGFIKKCGWFVSLLISLFLYYILQAKIVLECTASTMIITELVSCVENLGEIGINIPILSEYCSKINNK